MVFPWQTWTKVEGRMLVGTSPSDTDFSLGKTGGEKTHKLTTAEMPSHSHNGIYFKIGGVQYQLTYYTWSKAYAQTQGGTNHTSGTTLYTGNAGSGNAHNNMPPYLVVNIWKRTA